MKKSDLVSRHTLLRQFAAQRAEHVPPIEVGVQVERPRKWISNRVGIVYFLLSGWTGCSKRSAAGGAVSTSERRAHITVCVLRTVRR